MITLLLVTGLLLLIDYYVFQAVLTVSNTWLPVWKNVFRYGFWIPTLVSTGVLVWWFIIGNPDSISPLMRNMIFTGIAAVYFSKLFAVVILFVDDLQRGIRWVISLFKNESTPSTGEVITRSQFLSRTALLVSAVPLTAMTYGILSGAHDYRIRRKTVYLPNLPKAFDGMTIGQLSDIHSGSFFNKTAVKGGVDMMMKEKPDVIFFTGDLVNNEASEVKEYVPVFEKLKAPLGVYSVTGNHDYGDYKSWGSTIEKQKNFENLMKAHHEMKFDLMMNEHRFLEVDKEKIAVLGIENWGGGRFARYGKLNEAYRGTEEAPVKILLSHDPSHWDAEVRKLYPDIDLTFAGHTHGFQFGVEVGNLKWSPSQYVYKQWAGLYQEGSQYLYVNRGFGFLGYPGRIGMPPELTIIELKRA